METENKSLKEELCRERQRCKRQMLQARQEAEARDQEVEKRLNEIFYLREQLEQVCFAVSR